MRFNGYVAIVKSEPIIGLASERFYGPFETSREAWVALENAGVTHRGVDGKNRLVDGWSGAGVLPLRPVEGIFEETP